MNHDQRHAASTGRRTCSYINVAPCTRQGDRNFKPTPPPTYTPGCPVSSALRAHPIGGPLEDYRATADELARLIEHRWAIGVGDA